MDYKINTKNDILNITGSIGSDDNRISDMYMELDIKYPQGYSLRPIRSLIADEPGQAKIRFRIHPDEK